MFGELRVAEESDVERSLVTRTQDARRLFVLLALSPTALRREALGMRLWPDTPDEVRRARLRYSLAMLRRAVGDEVILSIGADALTLSAEVTVDVRLFWEQVQAAVLAPVPDLRIEVLQAALRLARSPFLNGWSEPWVVQERKRLEACQRDVVRALAADLTRLGREEEAMLWQHLISANDVLTPGL